MFKQGNTLYFDKAVIVTDCRAVNDMLASGYWFKNNTGIIPKCTAMRFTK
jgi:hypothetical protein